MWKEANNKRRIQERERNVCVRTNFSFYIFQFAELTFSGVQGNYTIDVYDIIHDGYDIDYKQSVGEGDSSLMISSDVYIVWYTYRYANITDFTGQLNSIPGKEINYTLITLFIQVTYISV